MRPPVVLEGLEPEDPMDALTEDLKAWEQTPTPVSSRNPFRSNNATGGEPEPNKQFPLGENVDLSTVSDLDLAKIADDKSAITLSWTEDKQVMRISRQYVLKCGKGVLESEGKALQVAAERGLNCPRVHRVFSLDEEKSPFGTCGYIVMDYIHAENLTDNWIFFLQNEQEDVITKVAEAICRMQAVPMMLPGPIGGGPHRGRFFSKPGVAAFNLVSEMESWFEQKLNVSKRLHQCPQDLPARLKLDQFVLVHQNLIPENLMIDEEGMIWIVGWSNAGAYPPYFERASIAASDNFFEFQTFMLDVLPEEEVEEKQLAGLRYAVDAASH